MTCILLTNKPDDLTGLIGVTFRENGLKLDNGLTTAGWFDHMYVSIDEDSSKTVESTSYFENMYRGKRKKYNGIRYGRKLGFNRKRTEHYLQIKLSDERKL